MPVAPNTAQYRPILKPGYKWFFNREKSLGKLQIPDSSTIQPDCEVDSTAKIGRWVTIESGSIIKAEVVIGTRRENATEADGVTIGSDAKFYKKAHVEEGVQIGDRPVLAFASRVEKRTVLADDVIVGTDGVVGEGAEVGDGVCVGSDCTIKPGAEVDPGVYINKHRPHPAKA